MQLAKSRAISLGSGLSRCCQTRRVHFKKARWTTCCCLDLYRYVLAIELSKKSTEAAGEVKALDRENVGYERGCAWKQRLRRC